MSVQIGSKTVWIEVSRTTFAIVVVLLLVFALGMVLPISTNVRWSMAVGSTIGLITSFAYLGSGWFRQIDCFKTVGGLGRVIEYNCLFSPALNFREVRLSNVSGSYSRVPLNRNRFSLYSYPCVRTACENSLDEMNRALVIGGGGASFPCYLLERWPNAHVDIVEICPTMAKAAQIYFLNQTASANIIIADARTFAQERRSLKPYDLIFLDLFIGERAHMTMFDKDFIRAISRRLQPDGLLIGNYGNRLFWPASAADPATLFNEVFDYTWMQEKDNQITVASTHCGSLFDRLKISI